MLDFCLVLQETSELALGLSASMCGGSSGGSSANNSSSITAASTSAAADHGVLFTYSLKFREHQSHLLSLLPHDLQHFPHRPLDALDPSEHPSATAPMDIDFATAVATAANFQNMVAAAAGSSGVGGNSSLNISTNSGVVGSAPSSSAASSVMPSCSGNDPNSVVLCKFCGKSFPDVTSLITHLPVHTGDRPFKCEFCGKAFKLRHHMKDHCRVHTGKYIVKL
uniref:C2H2-type domain-containing protein n=1 Tax=Megaselia scalaris TaxID=36166 RepID=T1GIA5_MEGSC